MNMKRVNLWITTLLGAAILLSGCGASNTAKGTAIGAGGGAAIECGDR